MKKRNIVLIGPMGTGKSRAAKILADGLDWQLADTDRMMERDTGMKIADFYRDAGAEAFAEKEMQVISRVRYYHEAVIAMGGNYPMTEEKFHLLAEHGVMVLLYAKPYRLAERVRRRIGKRPTMDYTDVMATCGRCCGNGRSGATVWMWSSIRPTATRSRPRS